MLEKKQIEKIKKIVEEFFGKMTTPVSNIEIGASFIKKDNKNAQDSTEENIDVVDLSIKTEEPQILIGQQGQTLFEIQRVLRMVLNKGLQKVFFVNLDINDYKKKKIKKKEDYIC